MTEEGAADILASKGGSKTIQAAFEKLDWALRPAHLKRRAINPELVINGLSTEAARGICDALGQGRFDPETRHKLLNFKFYQRLKATAGY